MMLPNPENDAVNLVSSLELDRLLDGNTSLFDTVLRDIADETIERNKALKKHAQMLSKPSYNILMDRYKARPHAVKFLKNDKLNKLADPLRGKFSQYDTLAKNGEVLSISPSSRSRGKISQLSSIVEKHHKIKKSVLEEHKYREKGTGGGFFLTETDGLDENEHTESAVQQRSATKNSKNASKKNRESKSGKSAKAVTTGGHGRGRIDAQNDYQLRQWDESFAAKRLPAPRWKKSYPSDDDVLRKKGIRNHRRGTDTSAGIGRSEKNIENLGSTDRKAQLNDIASKVFAAKQLHYRAQGVVASSGLLMRSSSASNNGPQGRLPPVGLSSKRRHGDNMGDITSKSRGLTTTATTISGSNSARLAPTRKRKQVTSAPSLLSSLQRVDSNPALKDVAPLPFSSSRRAPRITPASVQSLSPSSISLSPAAAHGLQKATATIGSKAISESTPSQYHMSLATSSELLPIDHHNDEIDGDVNAANAAWLRLDMNTSVRKASNKVGGGTAALAGFSNGRRQQLQHQVQLRSTAESLQALEKATIHGRRGKGTTTTTSSGGSRRSFDGFGSSGTTTAGDDDTGMTAAKLMMFAKRVEGNFNAATAHISGYKKIIDEDGKLSFNASSGVPYGGPVTE